MQSQEAACKGAEFLLRAAEKEAPSIESSWQAHQQNGKPAFFNIFDKLRELYVEESSRTLQQPLENLRPCSHLLEKLIQREKLNTLVVNLYPGTKGYSLQIRMQEGDEETQNETVRWPYSNDELLSYIDNEELPPFLADLVDYAHPRLYYSGCIIAEVRDYRQYHPTAQHSQLVLCDIHHVLLKPSTQSILNDVDAIASSFADEDIEWSLEDKLALEGALILAKTGPLCLDPSPAVGLMRQNLHHTKHVLNTPNLRQRAKKYSQTAINRKRKLDQLTKRPETVDKLADFISSHKRKSSLDRSAKKQKKETEPTPQGEALTCEQAVAEIMRLAKLHERPLETNDCSPMLVEEHVLETGHDPVKVGGQYYIKISIYQRLSNGEFIGKLYFNKESEGGRSHGSFCKFSLSSRAQVNRLIQQFTEVTTQDGKECFRISHIVPGHPARVTCTAAMRERDAKLAAQQQQQQALLQLLQQQSQQQQKQQLQQAQLQQQQQQQQQLKTAKMPTVSHREQIQQLVQQLSPQPLSQPLDVQQQQQQQLQQAQLKQLVTQQLQLKQQNLNRQLQKQLQQQQLQHQQLQQQQISQQVQLQGQVASMQLQPQSQIQLSAQPSQIQVQSLSSLQLQSPSSSHHQPIINNLPSPSQLQYATTSQPMKQLAQKPVQSVGKRISSVNGNAQNPNSPLAASPGQMLPSPTNQVISSSNGDIASSPSSSSNSSQPVKSPVMFTTNRAINALALSLMNSAQQFQEEAAAAAAAQAAAAAAQANANAASSANAQTINVQNLIQNNAGQQQQTVVSSGANHNNHSAILSLLNSTPVSTSPSVANPTLNNLLKNTGHIVKTSQFNPQVVAGKMTLTNLLNSSSAVTQAISSSSSTPVRVSLASLANLNQPLNQSMSQSLTQKTRIISAQHLNNDISNISINSLNSIDGMSNNNTQFIAYAGNNVQSLPTSIQTISSLGSGSIQTLAGTLTPAPSLQALSTGTIQGSIQGISGVQSVGSVQTNLSLPPGSVNVGTIRRVSVTSVNSQQSSSSNPSASTSSIGLSMPGLKALLAGAPAGDSQINVSNTNNSLLERLSTPPSYPSLSPKPKPTAPSPPSSNSNLMNLSIASLQDAMSTIPGLQNVQVSIGGISVPITVSLNVSPHINASQAVTTLSSVVSAANPAAMIFTNSSNSHLLSGSSKTQNVRTVQAGNINVIQNNAGSLQLLGTLQKTNLTTANKQVAALQQQRVINNQRFKVAAANAVINQHQLSAHQQIQLALQQKQAAQHGNRNQRSEN